MILVTVEVVACGRLTKERAAAALRCADAALAGDPPLPCPDRGHYKQRLLV